MYQAEQFPQEILDRHNDLLLHGRLTTHRNDGCWFTVQEKGDSLCRVTIYSPHPGHEHVDSELIPNANLVGWLAGRVDW